MDSKTRTPEDEADLIVGAFDDLVAELIASTDPRLKLPRMVKTRYHPTMPAPGRRGYVFFVIGNWARIFHDTILEWTGSFGKAAEVNGDETWRKIYQRWSAVVIFWDLPYSATRGELEQFLAMELPKQGIPFKLVPPPPEPPGPAVAAWEAIPSTN